MPRKPTLTCARCERPIWQGSTSLPQGKATCRPCRAIVAEAEGRTRGKPQPFAPELRLCKQCGDVYEAHVPNQRYCNAECRNARSNWGHARQNRATGDERGYGKEHRIVRARWQPIVEAGEVNCCLCGDPIEPGSKWHLDHTPDRSGYRGAAHAACNVRDGAIRGNQRRDRPTLDKTCAGCGSAFQTIYPKQAYCSTTCRPKPQSKPRIPAPPRNCMDCGQQIKQGKRCKSCAQVQQRTYMRNRYRAQVGIPLDVPKHDRSWRAA